MVRRSGLHPFALLVIVGTLLGARYGETGAREVASPTPDGLVGRPESVLAADLLEARLRGPRPITEIVVVHSDTAVVDDPAFRMVVEDLTIDLLAMTDVVAAATNYTRSHDLALISADRHATIVPLTLVGPLDEALRHGETLLRAIGRHGGNGFEVVSVGAVSVALAVGPDAGICGMERLPEGTVRSAVDLLRRNFALGIVAPVEIVVDGQASDPSVTAAIDRLITSTAALSSDAGWPLFSVVTVTWNADGDLALLSAPLYGSPCEPEAEGAVEQLRGELIPDAFAGVPAEVLVTGETARILDGVGAAPGLEPTIATPSTSGIRPAGRS